MRKRLGRERINIMGYNSIDGKKRCPKCGFAVNKLTLSIYCCPDKRYYKYMFFGKCNISGNHTHYKCARCGHSWIYLPTDNKWNDWQRNVVDKYKTWANEDIKNDLVKNALSCGVLCQNIEGDFNLGNIMRTCNSFGIVDFYYFGKKKLDKRSMLGCFNYMNINHLSSIEEVLKLKEKYTFIGIENNVKDTIPLNEFFWNGIKKQPLLIFGEEGRGLDANTIDNMDYLLEIPSRGSIRSLNVATAAGIIIWDYYRYLITH